MDDLADLADQTWSLAEDGYDFADETGDVVINILTDGYGAAADTASDLIDYVDDVLPDPPTFSGTGSAIQGAWHSPHRVRKCFEDPHRSLLQLFSTAFLVLFSTAAWTRVVTSHLVRIPDSRHLGG